MLRYVSLAGAALAVVSVMSPLPSEARLKNDPAALVPVAAPETPAAETNEAAEAPKAAAAKPAGEAAASGETVVAALENDPAALVPVAADTTAAAEHEKAAADNEARAKKVSAPTAGSGLDGLISRFAREHGLPVALARAVIRVESNFNPGVTGRAGEVGLMQIKPATARGIGYSGSTKGLYDPATNLTWGMKYLAGAYKLAGGDTCGTIMRYQGGHYARHMTAASTTYCGKVKRYMGSA